MTMVTPPRWAETILQVMLASRDRETVPGDLLEEYRENIRPTRGRLAADLWYVRQVVGFAWRDFVFCAALLSGSFIVRTSLDWFWPTADFHLRSMTSTAVMAAIFVSAGSWASRRSTSLYAGALAGIMTALIAAVISLPSTGLLLAIFWHDPQTLAAIEGSGGLREVFTLPVLLVFPGAILGAIGGLVGAAVLRFMQPVR